ncbi:sugar kinase [Holotrichia oblita]|nr:sugar kinase [Holotrichia oblita]
MPEGYNMHMAKRYVIALDEGTTSARALIYDVFKNEIIKIINKPLKSIFPNPGWVEQNPHEIYAAVNSALTEALILTSIKPKEIFSIGITNQRETVLLWDSETGEPCCNAIMIRNSAETEDLANSVNDTAGVYVVPAFTGLGAPYWNMDARGLFTGLTLSATKAHLVRAVLESIAYSSKDIFNCMQADSGINLSELKVDGGASANNFLMQFQADILNLTCIRPKCVESTALGAIFMSGLKSGAFKSLNEILQKIEYDKEFISCMNEKIRQEKYEGWLNAVKRTLYN